MDNCNILNNQSEIMDTPETEKHTLFYLLFGCFCALLFIRNVFDIQFPIVIMLAMGSIICLFASQNELMALALSCIPFSAGFQYKYLLIVIMAAYFLRFNSRIKNFGMVIPLAIMMIWELFHGVLDFPFSVIEYLRGFAELIFCTFIVVFAKNEFNLNFISRVLAFSTIFSSAIVLLNLLVETNFDFSAVFVDGNYRFGIGAVDVENYGMNYNANGLGFMINTAISGLLLLNYKKQSKSSDYVMVVILTIFGILTASRSFIICWIVMFLMFLFINAKSINIFLPSVMLFLLGITLLSATLYLSAPYLIDNIVARFQVTDITGGRSDLFAYYMRFLFAAPINCLFGTGMQDVRSKVETLAQTMPVNVSHNGIQELWIVWGVFGIVMFACFLIALVYFSKRNAKKHCLANYIPLLLTLFMVQSGQLITSGNTLITFAFVYVSLSEQFGTKS